ncbi:hypothetical protein GGR50DRAFT_262304 [Xylaria sp. CBS 124048]|nr:hypothetical protein GGR50DRAFT_262304 [Xylaria sp. CBS 124048]
MPLSFKSSSIARLFFSILHTSIPPSTIAVHIQTRRLSRHRHQDTIVHSIARHKARPHSMYPLTTERLYKREGTKAYLSL